MGEGIGKGDNMQKNVKENLCVALGAFAVALVCLLVESPSTCFLYPHFTGTDSSIFQYIGHIWVTGGIPYREVFDHKGPLLFLLNAFGFWITGSRFGILAVQVTFLTFSLFLVYKISRLRYGRMGSAVIFGMFLLSFCYFSSEGNLTEEYSLTFLLVPIYLALRYDRRRGGSIVRWMLLYMACVSAHF